MQLFGIPTCPYCRKKVNVIRAWSLKKHGEYRCPRCKGISNIYLSPLVYVFAFIAMAAGFLVYFFAKFISDSIGLMTIVEVLAPFVIFFLLTPFLVYFKKPVIRKVRKTQDGRFFDEEGNEMVMKMGKLVPNGNRDPRYARRSGEAPSAPVQREVRRPVPSPAQRPAPRRTQPGNVDIMSSAPKANSAPMIQPLVFDNEPEENEMELKIGRVTRERNSGVSVPNSGFEDLFENKDQDFEEL